MRIIIELDNEKSLTLNTAEKTAQPGDLLTTATAAPIEAVDGGAAPAPTSQFSALENDVLTLSDATVIDGGTAPDFANT